MKIENSTKNGVLFITLEVGNVFKYLDNLCIKINAVHPFNAYDLILQDFVYVPDGAEIQPVKATLVIEWILSMYQTLVIGQGEK